MPPAPQPAPRSARSHRAGPRPRAAVALVTGALVLAGCAGLQDMVAREGARTAVQPVLAARFPGVPLEPATDCIIDAATAGELTRLARGATRPFPDSATTALVAEIASRPDTIRCLTTNGLAPFLLR